MRELLDDIFSNQPLDPREAARRGARPQLRKRFYANAHVAKGEGGFAVLLDGRAIKTPGRRALELPARVLAQAVADEWAAQGERIDPAHMPLTRLANSIVDGVVAAPDAVAAEVTKYLGSDLLFYRAESPEGLVTRQARVWDPVLDWARDTLGADFLVTAGVTYVAQPETAIAAASAALPRDPWRLGALNAITTLTGSALLALAVLGGRLSAEAAWAAAHVDEDWNMEVWGRDELVLERRSLGFAEMTAAATVLTLCQAE